MSEQEKYYKEIEKKFSSDNSKEILNTLKEVKNSGKVIIIPLIIQLLDGNKDEHIQKEVLSVLGDLKMKEAVPYIVDGIKQSENNYRTDLIMTCWQSGLDFSSHIETFIEAFVFGDFQTAIEAFSVVEEWIHNSTKDQIENSRQLLLDNLKQVSEERKAFHLELMKLVESHLDE